MLPLVPIPSILITSGLDVILRKLALLVRLARLPLMLLLHFLVRAASSICALPSIPQPERQKACEEVSVAVHALQQSLLLFYSEAVY